MSVPLPCASTISKFLEIPSHPSQMPTKHGKSAGRVLTSLENLQLIQEREQQKQEKALQKEEKKRLREEKAKKKLEEAKRKKEMAKRKDMTFHCYDEFVGIVPMPFNTGLKKEPRRV